MKASLRAQPLAINRQLRHHLITTPSMEAFASDLIDRANNFTIQVGVVRDEAVSQETQQMDHHAAVQEVRRLQDQIEEFLPKKEVTGHPMHFLINPDQIASGDIEAQSTLTAIAEKAMDGDAANMVVAVLPLSAKKVEGAAPADETGDDFTGEGPGIAAALESLGVTVYTDTTGFINYLRSL